MTVFVVIGARNPEAIKAAIVKQYGAGHHQFTDNAWFVTDSGTTKDVADKLGIINNGLDATGIVLKFDGYSGYAARSGWDWLAAQPGTISNG